MLFWVRRRKGTLCSELPLKLCSAARPKGRWHQCVPWDKREEFLQDIPDLPFSWLWLAVGHKELHQVGTQVAISETPSRSPWNSLLSNHTAFSCGPGQSCLGSPEFSCACSLRITTFNLNAPVNVQSEPRRLSFHPVPSTSILSIQDRPICINLCYVNSKVTNPRHIWPYELVSVADCISTLIYDTTWQSGQFSCIVSFVGLPATVKVLLLFIILLLFYLDHNIPEYC